LSPAEVEERELKKRKRQIKTKISDKQLAIASSMASPLQSDMASSQQDRNTPDRHEGSKEVKNANFSVDYLLHDASPTNALSPCSLTEMTPQSVSSISEVGTPVKVEVGENF